MGIFVDDINGSVTELRAAGTDLVGDLHVGPDGYAWQHFRAPDGKVLELACDPAHT